jgi:hypothetical protein
MSKTIQDRRPGLGSHICTKVFIQPPSPTRATMVLLYLESFIYLDVECEFVFILALHGLYDFWVFPIHWKVAKFFVLGDNQMSPFLLFGSLLFVSFIL